MAQEYVLSEVNRKVKAQIAPGLRIVEIVPAKLANTAGMMGSVSLAETMLKMDIGSLRKHTVVKVMKLTEMQYGAAYADPFRLIRMEI